MESLMDSCDIYHNYNYNVDVLTVLSNNQLHGDSSITRYIVNLFDNSLFY